MFFFNGLGYNSVICSYLTSWWHCWGVQYRHSVSHISDDDNDDDNDSDNDDDSDYDNDMIKMAIIVISMIKYEWSDGTKMTLKPGCKTIRNSRLDNWIFKCIPFTVSYHNDWGLKIEIYENRPLIPFNIKVLFSNRIFSIEHFYQIYHKCCKKCR